MKPGASPQLRSQRRSPQHTAALLTVGVALLCTPLLRADTAGHNHGHGHEHNHKHGESEPSQSAHSASSSTQQAGLASGTGMVLGNGDFATPQLGMTLVSSESDVVELNTLIGDQLAVLFYFSAGCSHCEAAAPDIARLTKRLGSEASVLSIASGNNSMSAARNFADRFGLQQPVYKDFSRQFASRNKATSTPTVLVVRKSKTSGEFETLAEYRPFAPGMGLLVEMRTRVIQERDPWSSFEKDRYYGPKACGACHLVEYMSWGLTHHSVAYWTLYQRERAEDLACVGCHVTGLGEATGFSVGDHGSALADVSCEACHGPAGPHDGHKTTSTQTCPACHDKDHSIRFELERALPHIDHMSSASMDSASYQKARKTLTEGGAARPLTAFPEGKNLSSEACASCHPAETKHWKKSAHANALTTLKRRASGKNLECLPCHVIEREEPTEAKHYYKDGVSCEACHGPGEDHVAAGGGTENILGLGSSCPECIIDAVCTRCHTPEQDPDWDLQSDLAKIRHHQAAPPPAVR